MENKSIAWVCETYEKDGKTEMEVVREGMTRAEITAAFPPDLRWADQKDYNRTALIRAIIKEAYDEAKSGEVIRERKNIRGFWYERLKWVLVNEMGETGPGIDESVKTTISDVWKGLIESGDVTYTGLNLYSEKEKKYNVQVNTDSPYPRCIVVVEKNSLFEKLADIANTYRFTFASLGGQSSRAAAMAYVDKLDMMGIDTSQPFTVFSYADYDPSGWNIPEQFCHHLSLKAEGIISIIRIGVKREQLGNSVIKLQSIPYPITDSDGEIDPGLITKYDNFAEKAGGGIIDGQGVRRIVELDIYKWQQIRDRILKTLAENIDGFEYQKEHLKKAVESQFGRVKWDWGERYENEVDRAYQPYFKAIDKRRDSLKDERKQRAPEARAEREKLYQKIWELDRQIDKACSDLTTKSERLNELESKLRERAEREKVVNEDILPSVDRIVDIAASTGDWLKFVDILDIDKLRGSELADAARHRLPIDWTPDYQERQYIFDYIDGQFPDLPEFELPEHDPGELVYLYEMGEAED